MKATSLCYMLAATAVAGGAGAQEVLTEYMDTSFVNDIGDQVIESLE